MTASPPPVIELQGISAGQLSLVLTQYTPLETTTQNTADIGTNAAAIAALQGQVSALPAPPDLTPYALAADLAAAEGLIAANASGLTAVNTSLTLGLGDKGQPVRPGRPAGPSRRQEHAGLRGPQAGEPPDDSSDELQHRFRQQRHPAAYCGDHLCAEDRGGPAGHRRGRLGKPRPTWTSEWPRRSCPT